MPHFDKLLPGDESALTDLAVVTQDPRFGGGATAQVGAFLRAARALGLSPTTLYGHQPGLRHRPVDDSAAGVGASMLARGLHSPNQVVAARRLAPRLRAAQAVWVVAATADHGLAAARSGRSYTCWVGTSLDDEFRGRGYGLSRSQRWMTAVSALGLRRLEREVLQRSSRLFATTESSRAAVEEAAGGAVVGLLPIPVDLERFTAASDAAWTAGLERPTIVFVGRADDPRKNVPLLLDAFALVRRELPAARLQLVGTPPTTPVPAGVEVVGEVTHVAPYLRQASIFALPSWQEGFGIVVAEALASGVPVVTTPCGGPEELVRRSGGGTVIADFSTESMAEALLELAGSTETLRSCRAAGRAYVAREHAPERLELLLTPLLGTAA
jgi:glycosyltransferase involved in cell wall biosynthesis